jgi:hypothetical protein
MKHILATAFFAACPVNTCVAADDASAIVDKAIDAHGGTAALSRYPAGRVKTRGTIVLRDKHESFTSQSIYQMPDRLRVTIEMTVQGQKWTVVQVQNGERSSLNVGGLEQHMAESQTQEMKLALNAQNIARLVTLKDPKYRLTMAGENSFDGHATVGVRVSTTGAKDVTLHFDARTMLLAVLERPGFDANGSKVQRQDFYSDYRTADGLKYAGKTVVKKDGSLLLESEVQEFKPLEKIEPRQLAGAP